MPDDAKTIVHFTIANPSAEYPLSGVFGGVTPQGQIAASFYSERSVIPQEIDITLTPITPGVNQAVPVEGERRGKQGLRRTVTGTYYMDADMAESIGNWLLEKAAERRKFDAANV